MTEAGTRYEIRVMGEFEARWAEWFEGMAIVHGEEGETVLRGALVDQAALHGVLAAVRDLGLPLRAVTKLPEESGAWLG